MAMAMASASASCGFLEAKLNYNRPSLFHLMTTTTTSPSRPLPITFTTRIKIKPTPLAVTSCILPKPPPLLPDVSVASENHGIREKPPNLSIGSMIMFMCSFMCDPSSTSGLAYSGRTLAVWIVGSLMVVWTGVAGFMLIASFIREAIRPLLLLSTFILWSIKWVLIMFEFIWTIHESTESVIKLQVGLSGSGSSRIQINLKQIAKVADTSTPKGLHYILTETALNLHQNIGFCTSGYSSVDVHMNFDEWKKRIKLLSIEERCKFDEETLVNLNNIWTSCSSNEVSTKFSDEKMVVTILVAVKGSQKLPSINGTTYLKEALQKIASIPAKKIMAAEVFWTPQNENEMQWEQKLLKDFPLLRAL